MTTPEISYEEKKNYILRKLDEHKAPINDQRINSEQIDNLLNFISDDYEKKGAVPTGSQMLRMKNLDHLITHLIINAQTFASSYAPYLVENKFDWETCITILSAAKEVALKDCKMLNQSTDSIYKKDPVHKSELEIFQNRIREQEILLQSLYDYYNSNEDELGLRNTKCDNTPMDNYPMYEECYNTLKNIEVEQEKLSDLVNEYNILPGAKKQITSKYIAKNEIKHIKEKIFQAENFEKISRNKRLQGEPITPSSLVKSDTARKGVFHITFGVPAASAFSAITERITGKQGGKRRNKPKKTKKRGQNKKTNKVKSLRKTIKKNKRVQKNK